MPPPAHTHDHHQCLDLAQIQTHARELSANAPDAPQALSLRRRIAAHEAQITHERRKVSNDSGGLAGKLADYERLVLEREFAKQILAGAVRALETGRTEAQRQQLYLERIVEPGAPDYPMAPESLRSVSTVLAVNMLFLLVAWLVWAGVRERAAKQQHGKAMSNSSFNHALGVQTRAWTIG